MQAILIPSRQLYSILGEMLSTVFKDNHDLHLDQSLSEILESGISIDRKLLAWKEHLPAEAKMDPWLSGPERQTRLRGESSTCVLLSSILHLRYLNVRIVKERAVVSWFLLQISKSQERGSTSNLSKFDFVDVAKSSLKRIKEMAVETITIIGKASRRSQALGAWWFSTYSIMNACLVLLGYILVYFYSSEYQIFGSSLVEERQPITSVLDAVEGNIFEGIQVIQDIPKGPQGGIKVHRALKRITTFTEHLFTSIREECVNRGSNTQAGDISTSGNNTGTSYRSNTLSDNRAMFTSDAGRSPWLVPDESYESRSAQSPLTIPDAFELTDLMLGGVNLFGDEGDIDLYFSDLHRV